MNTRFLRLLLPFLLLGPVWVRAQDVTGFFLLKSLVNTQSTAGLPVPVPSPYRFRASVDTAVGGLLSGSVGIPGGFSRSLVSDGLDSWGAEASYRTAGALEADSPAGNYLLTLRTAHDGNKALTVAFPSGVFPNAPQVVNFATAQAVVTTASFAPTWTVFTGGTVDDYVRFSVETADGNEVFRTEEPRKSGALNGTSTSGSIPAGTLTPGQSYTGKIFFARFYGQNTDYGQGVTGIAIYVTETRFPLVTAGTPDVQSFGVAKGRRYSQSSVAAPVLVDASPYAFDVFVESDNGGVLGGSLKLPGGTTQPLDSNNGETPGLHRSFQTMGALDTAYPVGNYTVTLNTAHNGTKAITLPLTTSAFPNAPQVLNFAALQAADASAALDVTWGTFSGGGANDFVQLVVSTNGSKIFETPRSGSPGALTGTATSATIPANLLIPGQTYQVRILFARGVGSDRSYAPAFAAYHSQTELPMVTANGADVKRFGMVKGISYGQTSAGAPALGIQPYQLQVFTDGADGGVLSGSLRLPNFSTQPLVSNNGDSPSIEAKFNTQALLDAAYPPGNYSLTLDTAHNGTQTAALSLSATSFPNPPMVLGFAALQTVKPDAPLTVSWNPFTGGTVSDFVQFSIRSDSGNEAFSTRGPGDSASLNGTATSATIPAHTLQPGSTYRVQLLFARLTPSVASFADGFTGFFTETGATLKTTGVPDTMPLLVGSDPANGGSNVSVDSSIAFSFSEPMQSGHSINWSGNVAASNFTYAWSVDKRTLTCTYDTSLPAGSEINWVLNPAQSSRDFRDLAGNLLMSDTAGHFFTGGAVVVAPKIFINQNSRFWHIHADGAIGRNFLLQSATSLTSPVNWQPVVTFQGSANGFDFDDGLVRERNFYRVIPD